MLAKRKIMEKQENPLEITVDQINEQGVIIFENVTRMPIYGKPFVLPFILIILNHRGWIKFNYDMQIIEFNLHDIVMVPPGHVMLAIESSDDYLASLLVISPRFINKQNRNHLSLDPLEYHYNSAFHLDEEQYEGTLGHFQMLHAISQLNHPEREELLAKQMEVGTQLIEIYLQEKGITTMHEFNVDQQLLNRFQNLITKHFRESREVRFYANQLCLSPKYFGSVIKQQTGVAANEWISRYVIIQAKTLLRYRNEMSVQQVSYELGFQDPATFTRYFKTNTGLTPKEYREQRG